MPEVQTGIPGQKLAKRYGLKGITFAPSVEPIIVPVCLIDDLSESEPALAFCAAAITVTGAGGTNSQTALRNPTGSGILIENIEISFAQELIQVWDIWRGGPALTGTTTEFWQDSRRGGNPAGVVTGGTDAGATTEPIARGRLGDDDMWTIDLRNYILGPGDKLHMIAGINTDLNMWWAWSERRETAEEAF